MPSSPVPNGRCGMRPMTRRRGGQFSENARPVPDPRASGVIPEHSPMSAACHLELGGSEAGEAWPAAGGTFIEDLDGIGAWRDGGDLDLNLVGAERRYGLLSEKLHGRPRNRGQGRRRVTQDRPPFVEV